MAEETARLLAQVKPRIKAICERDEFAVRSFTATRLPDGSGYLKLETPAGATAAEVARYDAASGKRTVVVPSEKLVVPGGSQPLMLRWFQRAPSGNRFLLNGDSFDKPPVTDLVQLPEQANDTGWWEDLAWIKK